LSLSSVGVGGAVARSVPAELATKPTYALLLFIIWLEAEARTKLDNNNNIISDDTHTHARGVYERDTVRFMRSVLFLGTSIAKWDGNSLKHNNTWTLEPFRRRGGA